jgi:hypothetical protein
MDVDEYCGRRPKYTSLPAAVISAKAAPSACAMTANSLDEAVSVHPQLEEPWPALLPRSAWLLKSRKST